jgi:hypothetical protein
MESSLTVINNKFSSIGRHGPVHVYDGSTINPDFRQSNEFEVAPCSTIDFEDIKETELNYIPGDPEDKYPYIYDEQDYTRKRLKVIGKEYTFGWALEFVEGYLYRFTLDDITFVKIDPETDLSQTFSNDVIMNPRGLTWDGEYFFVNDFSLLKIFKFTIEEDAIKIIDSFDIPEKELGGTMGLTSDGDFLYLTSRDGSKAYKLDKSGNVLDEIFFTFPVAQAIVWTGEYFWTTGGCIKGICKYAPNGELVGEIYPVAQGTWAMTWDVKHLWTIQRTCEMWEDPKIYQIEILDDSLS